MKNVTEKTMRSSVCAVVAALVMLLVSLTVQAAGTGYQWGGGGDGTSWTDANNWGLWYAGTPPYVYPGSSGTDDAIYFPGSGGTITGAPAGGVDMSWIYHTSASNYSISGGPLSLRGSYYGWYVYQTGTGNLTINNDLIGAAGNGYLLVQPTNLTLNGNLTANNVGLNLNNTGGGKTVLNGNNSGVTHTQQISHEVVAGNLHALGQRYTSYGSSVTGGTILSLASDVQTGQVALYGSLDVRNVGTSMTPHTLSVGNLGFNAPADRINVLANPDGGTSNIIFDLNGSMSLNVDSSIINKLSILGDLDLTNAGALNVYGTLVPGTTYTIATYTGSVTGNFASVPEGWSLDFSVPGQVNLVPEPMSLGLLVLGGLAVLRRKR